MTFDVVPENASATNRAEYEQILARHFIPSEVRRIMLAYRLSKYGHRGQERDGGGRYFDHPRAVSRILISQGLLDSDTIIAALLHDLLEVTFILTFDDLEFIFGSRVAAIVKLLTKEPGLSKEDYFPRLYNGLLEASLVKLADRLHNMSTLGTCTREKQLKQVHETREKIMPLTSRLLANEKYAAVGNWFATELEAQCARYEVTD